MLHRDIEVALAARKWAQLNPEALMREPLTMDDYMGTRMLSDPLGKLDCCLVTDGAAAVVITARDRALDMATRPVKLLGAASMTSHANISSMPDLTVTPLAECGPRALAAAGLTPADIDVVELYDAFTINTILFLEDLGFCPKGEGGRFVEGGRIGPGGALPVNTNGGQVGEAYIHGMNGIAEAVRQLRGTASNQVAAYAFLDLLLSEQGQQILADAGYLEVP